jgi:hypothetical protein
VVPEGRESDVVVPAGAAPVQLSATATSTGLPGLGKVRALRSVTPLCRELQPVPIKGYTSKHEERCDTWVHTWHWIASENSLNLRSAIADRRRKAAAFFLRDSPKAIEISPREQRKRDNVPGAVRTN